MDVGVQMRWGKIQFIQKWYLLKRSSMNVSYLYSPCIIVEIASNKSMYEHSSSKMKMVPRSYFGPLTMIEGTFNSHTFQCEQRFYGHQLTRKIIWYIVEICKNESLQSEICNKWHIGKFRCVYLLHVYLSLYYHTLETYLGCHTLIMLKVWLG